MEESTSKYDLSTFIEGKEILLISDFEGTTSTTHFDKFKEYCSAGDNKRVIFLGDIFDNTAQYGPNCEGGKCIDPDNDDGNCADDSNYCALQTIKYLVNYEDNCRYVFGNRDINKIKLIPFFSFKNGEKWWKTNKKGTDYTSYADIVKDLLERTASGNNSPWLINGKEIKYFRPFWKNTFKNGKITKIDGLGEGAVDETTGKKTNKPNTFSTNPRWMDDNIKVIDIYDRFELIFGEDAGVGTMSALVTLKCLPNELFYDRTTKKSGINDFFTAFDRLLSKPVELKKIDWRKKIRAALTITLFMRMLDEDLWDTDKKGNITINNFGDLDGYLYYYYNKAPAAYYAINNNSLFLFAHGGITKQFVDSIGTNEIDGELLSLKVWENRLDNKLPAPTIVQNGGVVVNNKICQSIEYYNKRYFEILNNFFKPLTYLKFGASPKSNNWKQPMLTILDLTAGATKTNPNQTKDPSDQVLDEYFPDGKIFNIYGHAATSSGYSFGQARNKTTTDPEIGNIKGERTFFISTDYSTTLFKNGITCNANERGPTSDYNKNYLISILDLTTTAQKLFIQGTLVLMHDNAPKKDKLYIFKAYDDTIQNTVEKFDDDIVITTVPTLFYPKSLFPDSLKKATINFIDNENLLDNNTFDTKNKSKYFKFNGFATIGEDKSNNKYYVYSNMFGKINGNSLKYSIVLLPVAAKSLEVPPKSVEPVEELAEESTNEENPSFTAEEVEEFEGLSKLADYKPSPPYVEEGQGTYLDTNTEEQEAGGRRKRRRTRKYRLTHKKQKGGKRRTKKKRGRKTRRKHNKG